MATPTLLCVTTFHILKNSVWQHRRGMEVRIHIFWTSALAGNVWTSCSHCFATGWRGPSSHLTGDSVDLRGIWTWCDEKHSVAGYFRTDISWVIPYSLVDYTILPKQKSHCLSTEHCFCRLQSCSGWTMQRPAARSCSCQMAVPWTAQSGARHLFPATQRLCWWMQFQTTTTRWWRVPHSFCSTQDHLQTACQLIPSHHQSTRRHCVYLFSLALSGHSQIVVKICSDAAGRGDAPVVW